MAEINWKLYAAVGGVVCALSLVLWMSCSGGEDPRLRARPHVPDDSELPAAPMSAGVSPGGPPPPPAATTPTTTVSPPAISAPAVPSGSPAAATPLLPAPAATTAGWNLPLPTGPVELNVPAEMRRRLALVRLSRIAQALNDYAAIHKAYPPQALYKGDQPLLSWRVLLLPYLGHGDLYAQFRLNEPWDSPANLALAQRIPPVYQSPERADERTNFLVPHGRETFFQGATGVVPWNTSDGLATSVLVVEADNTAAVTWTEPRDLPVVLLQPVRGIGRLRGDGTFVAFGDGFVGMLPNQAPANELSAAFTAFGEEGLNLAGLYRVADPLAAIAAAPLPADDPSAAPQPGTVASPAPAGTAPGVAAATTGYHSPEDLVKIGQAAIAHGKTSEGFRLLQAAIVTSDAALPIVAKHRWVPALKRPLLAIRWGVGLQVVGRENAQPITWPGKPRVTRPVKMPAELVTYVGEPAERVLERLLDSRDAGRFGPLWTEILPPDGAPRPDANLAAGVVPLETLRRVEPIDPGFVYLGAGAQKQLVEAARQVGVDALVVFDVELKPIRGGSTQSTAVHLVDLVRGDAVVSSAALNTLAVRRLRETEPGAPDPVVAGLERVFAALEQQFSAGELPPELKPEHVEKRLETLAADPSRDPLSLLVEARVYHERRLVSDEQLLAFYRRVVGDVRGSQLFSGAFPQRLAALGPWLPQFKPGAVATAVRSFADE